MSGYELQDIAKHKQCGLFEHFFPKPLQGLDLVAVLCDSTDDRPQVGST
jgi:hypothetical protein